MLFLISIYEIYFTFLQRKAVIRLHMHHCPPIIVEINKLRTNKKNYMHYTKI